MESENSQACQQFRVRELSLPGKKLPPSIPLVIRSNYQYDPIDFTPHKQTGQVGVPEKLRLVDDGIQLLQSIGKPVAVLAICGPYRSGKSYFLSRVIRSPDAFKLGHTMHACTHGIWMGTKVLECDEFAVVLLDTEGIDAAYATESDATDILVLTTLLSSYLIYNSKDVPKRSDLEKMSCFAQLSSSILVQEGAQDDDLSNLSQYLPDFLWLLRDAMLDLVDENDDAITATEFLKNQVLVRSEEAMPTASDYVILAVRNLFPSLQCKTLPMPSSNRSILKNISVSEDKLEASFNSSLEGAVEYILQNIQSKKGFNVGAELDGSDLAVLAQQYVNALNAPDAVPNLKTSWEAVVDTKVATLSAKLIREYGADMEANLQGKLPMEEEVTDVVGEQPPETLMGIHERILGTKREALKSELDRLTLPSTSDETSSPLAKKKEQVLTDFEHQIAEYEPTSPEKSTMKVKGGVLLEFVRNNYRRSREHCVTLLGELYKPIQEKMDSAFAPESTYSLTDFAHDAGLLKQNYMSTAVGPAKHEVYQEKCKEFQHRKETFTQALQRVKSLEGQMQRKVKLMQSQTHEIQALREKMQELQRREEETREEMREEMEEETKRREREMREMREEMKQREDRLSRQLNTLQSELERRRQPKANTYGGETSVHGPTRNTMPTMSMPAVPIPAGAQHPSVHNEHQVLHLQKVRRSQQHDMKIEIVLVGDSNVGKSALLIWFAEERYRREFVTVGVDIKGIMIDADGTKVLVQIWDTAGLEHNFRAIQLQRQPFRRAEGVVMVCDVTDRTSLEHVFRADPLEKVPLRQDASWLQHVTDISSNKNMAKILVGNKSDEPPERREFESSEAKRVADKHDILYIETSAKEGKNVDEAFFTVIQLVLQKRRETGKFRSSTEQGIIRLPVGSDEPKKSKCC